MRTFAECFSQGLIYSYQKAHWKHHRRFTANFAGGFHVWLPVDSNHGVVSFISKTGSYRKVAVMSMADQEVVVRLPPSLWQICHNSSPETMLLGKRRYYFHLSKNMAANFD